MALHSKIDVADLMSEIDSLDVETRYVASPHFHSYLDSATTKNRCVSLGDTQIAHICILSTANPILVERKPHHQCTVLPLNLWDFGFVSSLLTKGLHLIQIR